MDDSQDSTISLSKDVKYDGSLSEVGSMNSTQQIFLNEFEREIQVLERDIRQQKESSVNAKTAITFDQLRKINNLSRLLGPQKETFFDRICRAAEIQRASLKNRLKQNKDRFDHSSTPQFSQTIFDSQGSLTDSQCFVATPTTIQSLLNHGNQKHNDIGNRSAFVDDDGVRFPADRQFELMQLGFSYEELRQLLETFESFKHEIQEVTGFTFPSLRQVLNQFSNYISVNPSPNIKLVAFAFNLLELGNSIKEVRRVLLKARQRHDSESNDDEPPHPSKKACSTPTMRDGSGGLSRSISPSTMNLTRNEMLLGIDKSPPASDDGTQKE